MMMSLDGRIDCAEMEKMPGDAEYYETLAALETPTTISGKVTAILHYAETGKFMPKQNAVLGKTTFSKKAVAVGYSVIVDTKGTLLWPANTIDDKPLVVVTSEQVSQEYLAYLDSKKISWIAAGKEAIDLAKAVAILHTEFGAERIAVVGGGHVNACFLNAGLLDEISILLSPAIDGRAQQTACFDGLPVATEPAQLKLQKVQSYDNGTIWLRYSVNH